VSEPLVSDVGGWAKAMLVMKSKVIPTKRDEDNDNNDTINPSRSEFYNVVFL